MPQKTASEQQKRENRLRGWTHRRQKDVAAHIGIRQPRKEQTRLTVKLSREEAILLDSLAHSAEKHPASFLRDCIWDKTTKKLSPHFVPEFAPVEKELTNAS
jgi:hypothetical protein